MAVVVSFILGVGGRGDINSGTSTVEVKKLHANEQSIEWVKYGTAGLIYLIIAKKR